MSDKISKEFWIGQIGVIVATILGVYLAASVGFQKAIDLEVMKSNKDTYYLMHSLVDEIENNIETVNEFIKEYTNSPYQGIQDNPTLSMYVFDAMKSTSSTFEIKPQYLNGIANYYNDIYELLQKGGTRKLGKLFMMKQLMNLNTKIVADLLDPLKETASSLKKKLKDINNIDI